MKKNNYNVYYLKNGKYESYTIIMNVADETAAAAAAKYRLDKSVNMGIMTTYQITKIEPSQVFSI